MGSREHCISKVAPPNGTRLLLPRDYSRSDFVQSQGPLAVLWVGIGLCCFYIALVWLNTLLGFFLTPLFIIPATWLMDAVGAKRKNTQS